MVKVLPASLPLVSGSACAMQSQKALMAVSLTRKPGHIDNNSNADESISILYSALQTRTR